MMKFKNMLKHFSKTEVQDDKTHPNPPLESEGASKTVAQDGKPYPCHLSQMILNRLFGRVLEREGVNVSCAEHTEKNLFTYLPIHLFTFKKAAFTLAEVLITLAIIGVVAAMTLPILINKYQEKQTVTRFKWVYSTLSNAFTMAVAENGSPENWELNTPQDMAEILSKYMKPSEKCYYTRGCLPLYVYIVALSGEGTYGYLGIAQAVKERFVNGIVLYYAVVNSGCDGGECGNIMAIISANEVNKLGLDHFIFRVTPKGIFPYGYKFTDAQIKRECSKQNNLINSSCPHCNGGTCGEWIRRWDNAKYWYN